GDSNIVSQRTTSPGLRERRPSRQGLIRTKSRFTDRRRDRGALVRGRAISAQRSFNAAGREFFGCRGALSQSPGNGGGAGGQALETARRHQPRQASPGSGSPL